MKGSSWVFPFSKATTGALSYQDVQLLEGRAQTKHMLAEVAAYNTM